MEAARAFLPLAKDMKTLSNHDERDWHAKPVHHIKTGRLKRYEPTRRIT
jgi:hypothetical protein